MTTNYIMYNLEEINNCKVKVLKLDNQDKQIKPKQYQMFGESPFPNIYITGMKNSGKTNLLAFIVMSIITSKTKLRIYSTTARNDNTMGKLTQKLEKYEFDYEIFDSPISDQGEDLIDKQFKEIQKEIEEDKDYAKSKWYYPKYIYIYDDMTDLLKYSKGLD